MNYSRIIDSWIAELRLGARDGRRRVSEQANTTVDEPAAYPEAGPGARPFALRLTRESEPVRQLSPCLGV
jgi:hypothetical protein